MASLKEKINYITNQFEAGKPAITGEPSNEFLMSVINELAADESNYAEFKDSIPAIHKAAMEELNVATDDSKHLLVSSMLKNSGISTTLKDENVTQKAIFVDFLLDKANKEGNDALNKDISELMDHAFDEKNKRIEVSSLLAVAHKCVTEAVVEENSVLSRYVASKNFDGNDYAKFCGALIAFNEMKDSFNYDLTETQDNTLALTIQLLDNMKKDSLNNPESKLNKLLDEAQAKYSKSFFSNDLDIEAQLHKVRAEENTAQSAGMISGYDLGSPVKDNVKEKAENKADQEKFDLMMTWDERYNDYMKKLTNIRVMTAGDKFQKRFGKHGFAPSTSNLIGDSVVSCDKFGDPTATLWNISPLTGTMKLSRDMRYDDPIGCQQAFTIAALNARRQGWNSVFLNHPGPDREAKAFIEHSFDAMVNVGDYSFDQISVPKRYQHVLDKLIQDALTGSIKNEANVTDELRNAPAIKPEDVVTDAPEQTAAASTPTAPTNSVSNTPDNRAEPVIPVATPTADTSNPDTVIPDTFDDDDSIFDLPKEDNTVNQPVDEFEAARLEEQAAEIEQHDQLDDSHLDNSYVNDEQYFAQDEQRYEPVDDNYHDNDFGQGSEIEISVPPELDAEFKASVEKQGDVTPTKPNSNKRLKL